MISPRPNGWPSKKELLGFYVSGHPMNAYAGLTEAIDTFAIDELLQQGDRAEFRLAAGIAGNIAKKLSKKDNRPWAAFTLATRKASAPLNMFADAFGNYGTSLAENATVLVQGNIIQGNDGARINVKECYPLDAQVAGLVRKVTWLRGLHPAHAELPAFLRLLRETLNRQVGDTRVEFAFLFENRVAPIAEASTALTWKLNAPVFQQLRAHPAVAGMQLETRRLELKTGPALGKKINPCLDPAGRFAVALRIESCGSPEARALDFPMTRPTPITPSRILPFLGRHQSVPGGRGNFLRRGKSLPPPPPPPWRSSSRPQGIAQVQLSPNGQLLGALYDSDNNTL